MGGSSQDHDFCAHDFMDHLNNLKSSLAGSHTLVQDNKLLMHAPIAGLIAMVVLAMLWPMCADPRRGACARVLVIGMGCAAVLYSFQLELMNDMKTPAVALMGAIGVGKSTLINTISSCLAGELHLHTAAGWAVGSFTIDEREHVPLINGTTGEPADFRLRDTPGDIFEALVRIKRKQEECESYKLTATDRDILCSDEYIKDLERQYTAQVTSIIYTYHNRKVGSVMLLLSAEAFEKHAVLVDMHWTVDTGSELMFQLQVFKQLQARLSQSGLRVFGVLSHIDKLEAAVLDKPQLVQTSPSVRAAIRTLSVKSGIPENQVYPILSFGDSVRPDKHPAVCCLAMHAFDSALRASRFAKYAPH